MEVAHERNKAKYDTLRMDFEMKRCRCKVLPVEMGCRVCASRTLIADFCGIWAECSGGHKDSKRTRSCSRVGFYLELAGITPMQIRHSPFTFTCFVTLNN